MAKHISTKAKIAIGCAAASGAVVSWWIIGDLWLKAMSVPVLGIVVPDFPASMTVRPWLLPPWIWWHNRPSNG